MPIASDFSITGKDIRHISGTTVYTGKQLYEWITSLADDAVSSGDDLLDILSDDPISLDGPRSGENPKFVNLLNSYNIDDTTAQFLNYCSIVQDGGNILYTGVQTIGSPIASGTPIYLIQNGAKLTKYWPNGHISILVKAKTGGTLIDSGNLIAYSRKYGQTYSKSDGNLKNAGLQSFSISTQPTDWTPLSLSSALALSSKVSITVGDTNYDSGDGNGSKLYKGTITLSGGITVSEAAQYLQAICDESSTTTINGVLGWQYDALDPSYTPNSSAPFGIVAGGKWFVSQGWLITGALPSDSQKYQMISHDGTTIANPILVNIQVGNLIVDGYITAGRANGTNDNFLTTEYTINGAHTSGMNTIKINESIKTDTPASGYIRVNRVPYQYSSYDSATKEFTLTGTLGQSFGTGVAVWVPFLDKLITSSTESSSNFTFNTGFNMYYVFKKGSASPTYKPDFGIFSVTSSGGSVNAKTTLD